MPVQAPNYRSYDGPRRLPGGSWAVIAEAGIRQLLSRRIFLLLLLFAWAPFLARVVQFYLATVFPSVSVLIPTAHTYRQFLDQQGFFVFVLTVYLGAGLIANDRRTQVLQIFLSKPLTRKEYVTGKLMILAFFLLLITWVPSALLLLVQVMLAGDFVFLRAHPYVLPAATVFTLVEVLVVSLAILALSALSTSSRFVAILYASLMLLSEALFGILRATTGSTSMSWISFPANLAQVGDIVFQMQPRYETPWPVSVVVIAGVIAVAAIVLNRCVRAIEVVT